MFGTSRLTLAVGFCAAAFCAVPAAASAASLDLSVPSASPRSDQNYALTIAGSTEEKASVTVYEDSDVSRPCGATALDEDDRSSARLVFFQEARAGNFTYTRDIRPGWFTIVVEDDTFFDEYVPPRRPASGPYRLCAYLVYTVGTNPAPNASDSLDMRFLSGKPELLSAPKSKTKSTSARFTFGAPNPDEEFECRLDAGSFRSCDSGITYRKLKARNHAFRVRSVASDGSVSANTTHRWRVVE